MIARLTGPVAALEDGRCVIEVGGVGYLVHASTRTLAALPAPPAAARLLIETQVREDAITLFGFAEPAERDWFRLLLNVQGVGAKVALGRAVGAFAARAGGCDRGRRPGEPDARAGRRRQAGAAAACRAAREGRRDAGGQRAVIAPAAPDGAGADALSALLNLGYRRPEAETALGRAALRLGEGAALDALIREGLKELAR